MSDQPPVRTALYDEHIALNGNMVDFHGFELPIWYANIKDEHLATRSGAGLFDVSHMGSFRFTGADVRAWLESIATQRVTSIQPPRCAYTHFLDEDGNRVDANGIPLDKDGNYILVDYENDLEPPKKKRRVRRKKKDAE